MGLFGFGKKKEEKAPVCCCQGGCPSTDGACGAAQEGAHAVKVLGAGCSACHTLLENTQAALADLGLAQEVDYVTDFTEIARYGVMSTPALVVDGKVVSCGKVLKAGEIAAILKQALG